MGFILALLLSGMIVYGLYRYAINKENRNFTHKEFLREPLNSIFSIVYAGFLMIFFWGVFIPPLGTTEFEFGDARFELWQIGGIGSFMCLIFWFCWPKR